MRRKCKIYTELRALPHTKRYLLHLENGSNIVVLGNEKVIKLMTPTEQQEVQQRISSLKKEKEKAEARCQTHNRCVPIEERSASIFK